MLGGVQRSVGAVGRRCGILTRLPHGDAARDGDAADGFVILAPLYFSLFHPGSNYLRQFLRPGNGLVRGSTANSSPPYRAATPLAPTQSRMNWPTAAITASPSG